MGNFINRFKTVNQLLESNDKLLRERNAFEEMAIEAEGRFEDLHRVSNMPMEEVSRRAYDLHILDTVEELKRELKKSNGKRTMMEFQHKQEIAMMKRHHEEELEIFSNYDKIKEIAEEAIRQNNYIRGEYEVLKIENAILKRTLSDK